VQLVREPVQRLVLLRVLQIEDVFVMDEDFADDGPGALELRRSRDLIGCTGQRGAGEQCEQQARKRHP
jgi:hypothetical protein